MMNIASSDPNLLGMLKKLLSTLALSIVLALAGCQSQAQKAVHADHITQTAAISVCTKNPATCGAARACSSAKLAAAIAWRAVAADAVNGTDDAADAKKAKEADAKAAAACASFNGGVQ